MSYDYGYSKLVGNRYSYTKLINNNTFVVLIEDDLAYEQFDEILMICKFPYELNIIENIYEFSLNKKYLYLIYNLITTCSIKVLEIKQ
jgi:hypothetical protein